MTQGGIEPHIEPDRRVQLIASMHTIYCHVTVLGSAYFTGRFTVEHPPRNLRHLLAEISRSWWGMLWWMHDESKDGNYSSAIGFAKADCQVCPACSGTGKYVGFLLVEECDRCQGVGFRPPLRHDALQRSVGDPLDPWGDA